MQCPTCGQHSQHVIETRQAGGMVRRRHQCIDGHRWNTYEVSETALRGIGLPRLRAEVARVARGIKTRQRATSRRELVAHLTEKGLTAAAIAREAGCTPARVRQIRTELFSPTQREPHAPDK